MTGERDGATGYYSVIVLWHCGQVLEESETLLSSRDSFDFFFQLKAATCMPLFCLKKCKQSACNVSCRCKSIGGNFVQTSFTLISVPTSWSKLKRKNGKVPRKENFGQMECFPIPWFLKTAEDISVPILSIFHIPFLSIEVLVETCAICFLISYRFWRLKMAFKTVKNRICIHEYRARKIDLPAAENH